MGCKMPVWGVSLSPSTERRPLKAFVVEGDMWPPPRVGKGLHRDRREFICP